MDIVLGLDRGIAKAGLYAVSLGKKVVSQDLAQMFISNTLEDKMGFAL